jgi:hypothetical protein
LVPFRPSFTPSCDTPFLRPKLFFFSSKKANPLETSTLKNTVKMVVGGWGWTSSTLDPFHTSFSVCRAHGDVTHGGSREIVSGSYSFPQHCMSYRLSVGTGLFTNLFFRPSLNYSLNLNFKLLLAQMSRSESWERAWVVVLSAGQPGVQAESVWIAWSQNLVHRH